MYILSVRHALVVAGPEVAQVVATVVLGLVTSSCVVCLDRLEVQVVPQFAPSVVVFVLAVLEPLDWPVCWLSKNQARCWACWILFVTRLSQYGAGDEVCLVVELVWSYSLIVLVWSGCYIVLVKTDVFIILVWCGCSIVLIESDLFKILVFIVLVRTDATCYYGCSSSGRLIRLIVLNKVEVWYSHHIMRTDPWYKLF